jgi:peptidoglycan/LPS O-acetylase OafA/YrhL
VTGTAGELPDAPAPGAPRHYLRQFDLYRVVAFVGVVGQHAVLWPVPGGSAIGFSLVMVLHATREVFFFLATLVACYSQFLRPRPPGRLWVRRFGSVVVPYLVWTLVYFVYSVAATRAAAASPGTTLFRDLYSGYYQLYFLVVLFQIYLLLPGLVWLVRRTQGHHGWVFGVSLVLQVAMMTLSHYFRFPAGPMHAVRQVDLTLITPRLVCGYQLYVVAGALAAAHLGRLQRIVERHNGAILWGVVGVGALAEGYYAFGLAIGNNPGHASDLFQPVAALWFLAACVGMWAIGTRWAVRAARRTPTRLDRLVTWGSDASGGYFLAHVLVLQLIYAGLRSAGLTGPADWGAASAVLFAGTLVATGVVVGVLMRTPLRRILTGPDRTVQRASYPPYPPEASAAAGEGEQGDVRPQLAST